MKRETLPKLTRAADGRYHGTYHGHEITVWRDGKVWMVQSGTILLRYDFNQTRADAVRGICDSLDAASVVIPELDQLLARWTAEIKALDPQEGKLDMKASGLLLSLRGGLRWLDDSARHMAVDFERDLAALKEHLAKDEVQRIEGRA